MTTRVYISSLCEPSLLFLIGLPPFFFILLPRSIKGFEARWDIVERLLVEIIESGVIISMMFLLFWQYHNIQWIPRFKWCFDSWLLILSWFQLKWIDCFSLNVLLWYKRVYLWGCHIRKIVRGLHWWFNLGSNYDINLNFDIWMLSSLTWLMINVKRKYE